MNRALRKPKCCAKTYLRTIYPVIVVTKNLGLSPYTLAITDMGSDINVSSSLVVIYSYLLFGCVSVLQAYVLISYTFPNASAIEATYYTLRILTSAFAHFRWSDSDFSVREVCAQEFKDKIRIFFQEENYYLSFAFSTLWLSLQVQPFLTLWMKISNPSVSSLP